MALMYKWREGTRVQGVKAQAVGDELMRIRDRDGKLETHTIVEEARNQESPLHPAFEWDDTKAAEEYRLAQARHLTKALVVVTPDEPFNSNIPVFVHVAESHGEQGYYQSAQVAVSNPDEWALAIARASDVAQSAVKALSNLRRLAERKGGRTLTLITKAEKSMATAKTALDQLAG